MRPLAVVTMMYNEYDMVPVWCHYYGKAIGPENCFILDHGSDDGSLGGLNRFNVIRLPRTPFDDHARSAAIASFAQSLGPYFKYVAYVDADEIILVDPRRADSLSRYCEMIDFNSVTSIGFDLCHKMDTEGDFIYSAARPILQQRKFARFSSAMCKPNLARPGVRWAPGFHGCQYSPNFDAVFLLHLHFADRRHALRRLGITRNMEWGSLETGEHHRAADSFIERYIADVSALPVRGDADWDRNGDELGPLLRSVEESVRMEADMILPALDIFSMEIYKIPERFANLC